MKVTFFRYRPLEIRKVKATDFFDFRHYEGGKVVTLTHRPLLTPGVLLVLIFRGWVDPRAHSSVCRFGKIPRATPLRIDPETSRLVAQCLNHYATPGPNDLKNKPWELAFTSFTIKCYPAVWLFSSIQSQLRSINYNVRMNYVHTGIPSTDSVY
jgi:hypothetical protein